MGRTIGIVGAGHLAGYLVQGLMRLEKPPAIVVSPRNAEKARELAERFGVSIAEDNQAVIDAADIVILATRPPLGTAAIDGLSFRPEQIAVTIVAGMPLAVFSAAAAPARVHRAIAHAGVSIGASPVFLYPDAPELHEMFSAWGPVEASPDEAAFEVATVFPVFYAALYRIIEEATRWGVAQGLEPAAARDLATVSMKATAAMAEADRERPLPEIIDSLATKGGLTERMIEVLEERGAIEAWSESLDVVLRRVRGDMQA
ncbi:MAG: NAD(P)-binding domain-containing protein [Proteobacteria bacterium]|nr:NAD(P)-binding domain-containing protein [Pseudomonadota bacterium]